MELPKYTVRALHDVADRERASLLRHCFVVVTSEGVLLEVGDRVVRRFDSLEDFLRAFDLKRGDLREVRR